MNYFQIFITTIFYAINMWILFTDMRERRIPNILLIYLLGLLPIWYIGFPPGSNTQIITGAILSILLLVLGIFLHKKEGLVGAGDLKYIAILILFLSEKSLSMFILNIGVLTLLTLLFLLSMMCGGIFALRRYISKEDWSQKKISIKDISLKTLGIIVFDWVILGYLLKEGISIIFYISHGIISLSQDFYFLLSIVIFLTRGIIRQFIFEGKYTKLILISILTYFLYQVDKIGLYVLYKDIAGFIDGIWIYAFIIGLLYLATNFVFKWDYILMVRAGTAEKTGKALPYSLILFLGFYITYFLNLSLISFIL